LEALHDGVFSRERKNRPIKKEGAAPTIRVLWDRKKRGPRPENYKRRKEGVSKRSSKKKSLLGFQHRPYKKEKNDQKGSVTKERHSSSQNAISIREKERGRKVPSRGGL